VTTSVRGVSVVVVARVVAALVVAALVVAVDRVAAVVVVAAAYIQDAAAAVALAAGLVMVPAAALVVAALAAADVGLVPVAAAKRETVASVIVVVAAAAAADYDPALEEKNENVRQGTITIHIASNITRTYSSIAARIIVTVVVGCDESSPIIVISQYVIVKDLVPLNLIVTVVAAAVVLGSTAA
jgi:hypothetical protein